MQQRSDEWFKARAGNATASRFGDVMATGKNGNTLAGYKNYLAQLVIERLTGQPVDIYQSKEMLWGTEYEPTARLFYELATGDSVEETGFLKHDELAAGASPDGLVNSDGLVEIKCPNTSTHLETLHSEKVPKQYYWQMQGQMWITGRAWCDYVSFDPRLPENARLKIIRVNRNQDDIDLLQVTVKKFLDEVEAEVEFIKNYGKEKSGENKNAGKAASISSPVNA